MHVRQGKVPVRERSHKERCQSDSAQGLTTIRSVGDSPPSAASSNGMINTAVRVRISVDKRKSKAAISRQCPQLHWSKFVVMRASLPHRGHTTRGSQQLPITSEECHSGCSQLEDGKPKLWCHCRWCFKSCGTNNIVTLFHSHQF